MRVVFHIVVVCALLFQRCASEGLENSNTSQSYAIDGTYIFLNTSTATDPDRAKCPQNISVEASALKYERSTGFTMNLQGLKITTVNCIYGTEEATNIAELKNHTVSFGSREPMKSYTLWDMTLPANSLTCTAQDPPEPFYGGTISFVPVSALQESLDMPDDDKKTQDGMGGNFDYLLLLGNESMDEMCTFFPAAQYSMIKKLIEERYEEHIEEDDMRIGIGKTLKFCTICECGEKLGEDLDLDSIEMKEETSFEMPSPDDNNEVEQESWRPPEVRIKNHRCPVAYSNRFDDVVNEEDEDGEESETESDKREESMASEGSKDTFKETKKLVLYAVVNKLYDEVSSELGEEFNDSGFDMRRTIVTLMTSFHRRRVMFMKKGAKCGGAKQRPIDKDTVFLYEKKHILRQLHHKQFIRRNMRRVNEILGSEEEGAEAFTLHVLQKDTDGRFSACAMSNSEEACALLNQNSFCESFQPLGSKSNASPGDKEMGREGGSPPGPGGRPTDQENSGSKPNAGGPSSGSGPPIIGGPPSGSGPPSTGAPATIGGQPSNGGTGATVQPGDKPDPGTGNGGSSDGPGGPGQGSGTPGPSSKATNTSGGSEETPPPSASPTPSPTPVKASPTPTQQASTGSSGALCFPGTSRVELEDGGMIRMNELKVGDSIRDGSGGFSRVILFTHSARDVVSEFVRLETNLGDIVLSAQHYLPVNERLTTGESAKVGDRILVLRNNKKMEAMIRKIERVWMRGLFNPQTTSGSIAVWMNGNGVIASAYTSAVEPNVAHSLLAPLRMLHYMVGWVIPWSWVFKNGADKLVKMLPSGLSLV